MAKEVTVTFKQILHPQNLATCLSEIVKYVLYNKSQIPLPYDQLVKDKPLQEHTQKAAASLREDGDREPPVTSGQAKRLQDRVKTLQQHISCIRSMCLDAGSSIQEMLVILGATLVSPKEAYRVKIENGLITESAAVLAQDNLTRYIVRSLVHIGLEANTRTISPTNCFVLFFAQRSSKFGTAAFPRMSFKVVPRGSHVCLHLNLDGSINCQDGSINSQDGSINGQDGSVNSQDGSINSQDASINSQDGCQVTQDPRQSGRRDKIGGGLARDVQKQAVHREETVTKTKLDLPHLMEKLSLDKEGQKDDYIWFQSATVFHGFKELPVKSNCKEDWSKAGNIDMWA